MRAEAFLQSPATGHAVARCMVIVNGRAGQVLRRPGLVREIARVVGTRGEVVRTDRLDLLGDVLLRARASGADTIAICGGDGTNLHTLTALARAWGDAPWPRIALVPGGTLNTGASNLGWRGDAVKIVANLLSREVPRIRRMPLLRANGRVGLIFGSQMVARILDEYYAGMKGPVGAALLAVRLVSSAVVAGPLVRRIDAAEDVTLQIDGGEARPLRLRAIAASVVPSIAVGLRLLPRAGEDDGFQLVATDRRASEFAPVAARLWTGLPVDQITFDVVTKRAVIRHPGGLRYTMDGDLFVDREVTLEATRPVEVVVP